MAAALRLSDSEEEEIKKLGNCIIIRQNVIISQQASE